MSEFLPDTADPAAQLRWAIVDALRRYGSDSAQIRERFAAAHGLAHSDLRALVAIMSAEGQRAPLTPGQLRNHLQLSSAGTSYVIDRLVESGHVERRRDHPTDNRVVHLHYTASGRATALEFFGPLGARTDRVMEQFTHEELAVVARFLAAIADAMALHVAELST